MKQNVVILRTQRWKNLFFRKQKDTVPRSVGRNDVEKIRVTREKNSTHLTPPSELAWHANIPS